MEARHGPVPDAAELARYADVLPEAPRLIFEEFQRQASHRRAMEVRDMELEEQVVRANIAAEKLGMYTAVVVVLFFLAAAVGLIVSGHETSGTIIGSIDIVALATVFVVGRFTDRNNEEPEE
jgi:uncharacterized membrane protein